MHYHLALILPDPRQHGLLGYSEVMETLAWGLEQLDHATSTAQNALGNNAVNVLFGAQLLHPENIRQLPPNTVIYNLEQLRGRSQDQIPAAYAEAASRLQIWDYSEQNLLFWESLNPARPVKIAPISYAPVLTRILKPAVQDIDVLFYGLPNSYRAEVFEKLSLEGLRSVFVSGLYGKARDELIARSKIVLNLNRYARSHIFEVVRVSYLLANAKAVVSDLHTDSEIPADLRNGLALFAPDQILPACLNLLEREDVREALEQTGLRVMQGRDIRAALRAIL